MRKYKSIPISAEYNGVLFKSTLESRFAKLMDCTNIFSTWTYEPRRINGYLVDFEAFCPIIQQNLLIEIKPGIEFVDFTKYANAVGKNPFIAVFVYEKSLRAISLNCPEIQDWINNWFELSPVFRYNWGKILGST